MAAAVGYSAWLGLEPPSRAITAAPACGVGRSFRDEFLIALRCVSSGEQTGGFLDFDGLHQYAFLPVGQTRVRPNGPGDPSPGLRPEADALGKIGTPSCGLKGRENPA